MSGSGTHEHGEGLRLVIGADSAGAHYKDVLRRDLEEDTRVASVVDIGVDIDGKTSYPTIAIGAAEMIASGLADRAVLICGTGLGMAISANKVPGVRAATAHDSYSVERSVLSNNAQVLAMGERVVGLEVARRMVREWLGYRFDPLSASAAKVRLIDEIDLDQSTTWQRSAKESGDAESESC